MILIIYSQREVSHFYTSLLNPRINKTSFWKWSNFINNRHIFIIFILNCIKYFKFWLIIINIFLKTLYPISLFLITFFNMIPKSFHNYNSMKTIKNYCKFSITTIKWKHTTFGSNCNKI